MGNTKSRQWVATDLRNAARHVQAGSVARPHPCCNASTRGIWRRLTAGEVAEMRPCKRCLKIAGEVAPAADAAPPAIDWPVPDDIPDELARVLRRAALALKEAAALAHAGGFAKTAAIAQTNAEHLTRGADAWARAGDGDDDDD